MDAVRWQGSARTVTQSAFYSPKEDDLVKRQYSISGYIFVQ